MTDNRLKGRVKGLFGSAPMDAERPEQIYAEPEPDPDAERQALQVLVLARRTADTHVSIAQQQAEEIRSQAQAQATALVEDAQARATALLDDTLAEADSIQKNADKILFNARADAEKITRAAQDVANGLEQDAQQRYQNEVGILEIKRAELQLQLDALTQFEQDYRARLTTFMHSQLRALGVDEQVTKAVLAQRPGTGQPVPVAALDEQPHEQTHEQDDSLTV